MELSKYVIDAISAISITGSRHNYAAARTLREASELTEDHADAHALELASGVLSMSYSVDKHEFSPLARFEGKRTFAVEDIQPGDAEIIEKLITTTENNWARTRFSHVVWSLTGNYKYGQLAVTGYLQQFEDTFDPEHWLDCDHAMQCAFHIASQLGKKADSFKNTRATINKKLSAMDGTDPLFLSLSLLGLVIKDATQKEMELYLPIITKLASKNICAGNTNTHLADETFAVQESLLKRLKQHDAIKTATLNYASYYESYADTLAENTEYLRAVIMLKQACTLYSAVDRVKLLELRSKLEDLQKLALGQMQSIPFTINTESTYKLVEQCFNGLTIEEAVVQIARFARIYKADDVKQQILKKQQESVVSSMFGSNMLNEEGQTVQDLPPLSKVDVNENNDALFKHMVHHVSEQRRMIESITLGYAFRFLRQLGEIGEESLDFLVSDNAIVPESRREIVKEGLHLGLTGKLYTAMHILLPQTENIFRNLVKICGDTVTYLKDDGTESYKPLSALLGSEKLGECYNEDIIFTFRSIMDEPIGENLRNLNAHGLLEPQRGNSMSAVCFLCLLIKLLVMYSPKAQPILKKLAAQDGQE